MLDLLIRDAEIVDGTGAPARRGDVGVEDGRIVAVGDVDDSARRKPLMRRGRRSRPASSTCTRTMTRSCSGTRPRARRCMHGVTTVFGGNCGFTLAPAAPDQHGLPHPDAGAGRGHAARRAACRARLALDVVRRLTSPARRSDRRQRRLPRWPLGDSAGGHGRRRGRRRRVRRNRSRRWPALLGARSPDGAMGFSTSQSNTHNDGDGQPVPSRSASREELVALAAAVREHPGTQLEAIIPGCLIGLHRRRHRPARPTCRWPPTGR